jgi:hypothetical protein
VANELFTARNVNGQDYRASLVWWRRPRPEKWITVAQRSLLSAFEEWKEEWELERYPVVAEAAVSRGGLAALAFRPTLIINYSPDRPWRLDEETFREIVRQIVEQANLVKIIALERDDGLEIICDPYHLVPKIGYRKTFLWRTIPQLVLFEWPAVPILP